MKKIAPRWTIWLLFIVTSSVVCIGCQQDVTMRPHWVASRHVSLGLETPGTSIDEFALEEGRSPAPTEVRVTTPRATVTLNSLKQLQDLVNVRSADQALHFVRLRTSRCYCYDWPGNAIQEVISTDQIGKTTFADTGCPGSVAGSVSTLGRSGLFAILSPWAYRRGRFVAPTVHVVPGGYQITRWVCVFRRLKGHRIQKWQETVGSNGSYRLVVLKSQTPPKLPGTQWGILGLQ